MITNLNVFKSFKDTIALIFSAILAGLCISIGGTINLMVGGGIIGAILFTFGLITVVHYAYALYTGTAGFVSDMNDIWCLILILIGNVIGCYITAELVAYAMPDIIDKASGIVYQREQVNIWQAMIRGMFCGFLMTTAVYFGRKQLWLPLLFAVPVFILAGFYHSIADAFYICTAKSLSNTIILYNWLMTVLGNFIGCNLYRMKFK